MSRMRASRSRGVATRTKRMYAASPAIEWHASIAVEVLEQLRGVVGLRRIERRDLDERRQRLADRLGVEHRAIAGDHAACSPAGAVAPAPPTRRARRARRAGRASRAGRGNLGEDRDVDRIVHDMEEYRLIPHSPEYFRLIRPDRRFPMSLSQTPPHRCAPGHRRRTRGRRGHRASRTRRDRGLARAEGRGHRPAGAPGAGRLGSRGRRPRRRPRPRRDDRRRDPCADARGSRMTPSTSRHRRRLRALGRRRTSAFPTSSTRSSRSSRSSTASTASVTSSCSRCTRRTARATATSRRCSSR